MLLILPPSLFWRQAVVDQIGPMSKRLYVVLDGLDECDEEERRILLDIITSNNDHEKISWLVFSRFLPDIAQSLNGPNMVLRPTYSAQEVRRYAEKLIDHSPSLRSLPIKTEIVERISRESGGLCLWVKLIIQLLEKEEDVASIRDVFHSLPLGMDGVYHRIIQSLDHNLTVENARVVCRAFRLIACAARPLTLRELSQAVALLDEENGSLLDSSFISHCGPLLSVSNSKVVGFIHRTFEEYLASDRCVPSFSVKYRQAHTEASNVCLLYLSNSAFATRVSSTRVKPIDLTLLSEQYPLLPYAALFWPEHIDFARGELNPNLMRSLSEFIASKNLLTAIEVALTIGGVASLQKWIQALTNLEKGLQKTSQYENVQRFIFDFQRFIRAYGYILDKRPSDIHSLIDESFPRNCHFWKYFGRPLISSANGQRDEWDPLITTLKEGCITTARSK